MQYRIWEVQKGRLVLAIQKWNQTLASATSKFRIKTEVTTNDDANPHAFTLENIINQIEEALDDMYIRNN